MSKPPTRPRLLDLFCGAGGAAMGYHSAGFEVVGVDIRPQPRYPFEFHQGDALSFPLEGDWAVIHASPPCQAYCDSNQGLHDGRRHPRLIEPIRERLLAWGGAYVIENVDRAPLRGQLLLCGTMFGLRVIRHRIFEASVSLPLPPADCNHWGKVSEGDFAGVYGRGAKGPRYRSDDGRRARWGRAPGDRPITEWWAECMGVTWTTVRRDLTEMIPPAYTEWIGGCALRRL